MIFFVLFVHNHCWEICKQTVVLPMAAWGWRRWGRFSSSELCKDEGSTSETPESAGLGGSDPRGEKQNINTKVKFSSRPNTNCTKQF